MNYTSIEQSKKLIELGLSPKSADMYYLVIDEDEYSDYPIAGDNEHILSEFPCWSVGALLSVLPDYTLQTNTDGTVFVVCESKKPMISDAYNNPIDACYEIILKLHELNLL